MIIDIPQHIKKYSNKICILTKVPFELKISISIESCYDGIIIIGGEYINGLWNSDKIIWKSPEQ
jgi:hypothetical protein